MKKIFTKTLLLIAFLAGYSALSFGQSGVGLQYNFSVGSVATFPSVGVTNRAVRSEEQR